MKNNIAVITGGRYDYGLLKQLIKELSQNININFNLFVTGAHLSTEFGNTYKEIVDDGFHIKEKVEMLLSTDTDEGIAKSIGLGIISFVQVFKHNKIDKIIILGDRYEIFAAVQAAAFLKLKIIHIHGGEITEGVIDDNVRHSITKFSHLHFVANDEYRKRVIQLGEDPKNVFNVGATGLDNIKKATLLSKSQLKEKFNISFKKKTFIATFHPFTELSNDKNELDEFFSALDQFDDATIIFTYANADAGSKKIIQKITNYVMNKKNCYIFNSLGSNNYYSFINLADLVIGNSSSGIIEAPFLKTPTIDIGNRQKGRLKASSILTVPLDKIKIVNAIKKIMSKKFQSKLKNIVTYYGNGNSTQKIIKKLMKVEPSIVKKFYDVK